MIKGLKFIGLAGLISAAITALVGLFSYVAAHVSQETYLAGIVIASSVFLSASFIYGPAGNDKKG